MTLQAAHSSASTPADVTVLVGGLTLPFACLLGFVALQRVVELAWSHRNLARLDEPHASETDRDYLRMVLAHLGLIVAPGIEAALHSGPPPHGVFPLGLALFLAAQALRLWTLGSLGRAWNARAVVDPALGFVASGPYRWIRHPNYLAVLVEFVALPLAGGAWVTLCVLNLLHAPVLARRIRGEERQLDRIPGYREAMAGKGRFLPSLARSASGTAPARPPTGPEKGP